MTEQLRQELQALREASRKKADDTRRLADELETVIATIIQRTHESARQSTAVRDRHEGHDSTVPLAHPLQSIPSMDASERLSQREALERLQNEMREHVADAAALADRIAALQSRIHRALAELTPEAGPATTTRTVKI